MKCSRTGDAQARASRILLSAVRGELDRFMDDNRGRVMNQGGSPSEDGLPKQSDVHCSCRTR
jgi:hypothetical protein